MKLSEIVADKQKEYNNRIILVKVNSKLQEITDKEITDEKIEFVTTDTTIGNDTYKRSVCMLMVCAVERIVSQGKFFTKEEFGNVYIDYSLSKGLYCKHTGTADLTKEFLVAVEQEMHELADKDIPIVKELVKTKDAIKIFEEVGLHDKVRVLKFRRSSYINIYSLDGYKDYYYGYMAPSTGSLKYFSIEEYKEGFVLQLPVRKEPEKIPVFDPPAKLFEILKESSEWADMLDVHTVGAINEHIAKGDMGSLILVQEALQEQKIHEIVNKIQERGGVKFVMIAGPSSSGKTTFSHRLSVQLRAKGYKPHPIAVDDYFVEREQTPLDDEGNYDFESLYAVDIELFNKHMGQLLAGEEVDMPTFNFKIGRKEYNGKKLKLGPEDILVIEGIHCLNDELSYSLPVESKFKIYISALTQLNIDEHNRVATTDGRLIRRMVRDHKTRGASARKTLSMWQSVRRGEEKNIFPFQEHADVVFNSALTYEISVLKNYVEPLLFAIEEGDEEYQEAKRLLKFLSYFLPCGIEYIPINSIMREFVGGGCFEN